MKTLRTDELKPGMTVKLNSRAGTLPHNNWFTIQDIEALPRKQFAPTGDGVFHRPFMARTLWLVQGAAEASQPSTPTTAAPAVTHIRTEDGTTTLITTRAALDEINAGMMRPTKRLVRQMSAARSSANIEYRDGRKVDIRPATAEELAALTAPQQPEGRSYTVVFTGGGEPIVHATGCAHNVRDSEHGAHRTQVITGALTDVCRKVFSDFLCDGDDPDEYLGDLSIKPCAR